MVQRYFISIKTAFIEHSVSHAWPKTFQAEIFHFDSSIYRHSLRSL